MPLYILDIFTKFKAEYYSEWDETLAALHWFYNISGQLSESEHTEPSEKFDIPRKDTHISNINDAQTQYFANSKNKGRPAPMNPIALGSQHNPS